MAHGVIVVKAARDPEAGVWYVESSDFPGLNAEAATLEELVEKLPAMIADLEDEEEGSNHEGDDGDGRDVPVELIAYASTRVRLRAGV